MRESVYRFVVFTMGGLIGLLFSIRGLMLSVVGGLLGAVIAAAQVTTRSILSAIDGERYRHQEALAGQIGELSELDVLMQASRVKEDALRSGRWTLGHTIAMNRVTFMLQARFGWDQDRVVTYIKDVVKDIPGVECQVMGEDADEQPQG